MTNDDFNKCLLPIKLDFRTAEAARLVLVVGCDVSAASRLCGGMSEANITNAVNLINDALIKR